MTSFVTYHAYQRCLPMMSELLAGGEILDALSVLGDIPDYLSDILNGHDGVDTSSHPSSPWSFSHAATTSTDQQQGTTACCCYLQPAVTWVEGRYSEGGLHRAPCPHHTRAAAAGMTPTSGGLDADRTHPSLGTSLHQQPLYPVTTAHNTHHHAPRQPVDTDHSAMYHADMSYYWGSESGGDSCSPDHTPDTYLNQALPILHIKRETPKLCDYSTNVPAYMDIDGSFSKGGDAFQHHHHQQQLQSSTALSVVTAQVVTSYPDPGSPQSATSSVDSSGGEDENIATDGETPPRLENHVKITGIKSDRRLRRREQNRQAARRCRQRKKEQSQELVKEYYQLLTANSEIQSKLKSLETEKQRLLDVYEEHLVRCSVHL